MTWPMVELGELVTIKGGGTPSKSIDAYWGGDVPWASVKDFKSRYISQTQDCITQAGVENSATNIIPEGVIVIPTRMALGKVAITACDMAINQDLKALFVNDECTLDRNYLARYLESKANYIESEGKGATVKGITLDFLKSIKVPLPPLAEQKRIAAILDKADAIRLKRQQAIALADDFLRSVFLDLFGDPVTNPKGWTIRKLGELINSGPTHGLYKPSSSYGSGTRILRIDGFYDGVLTSQESLKRVEVSKDELSRFSLPERSIIINRVNSPDYLGKCAFINELDEPTVFESNMMCFTVDEELINPVFLTQQLQMPNIKQQIKNCAKDAVNQSSINQQDVKSFDILLPDVEEQNNFESICNELIQKRKKIANGLSLTDYLFNSLAQKTFSG